MNVEVATTVSSILGSSENSSARGFPRKYIPATDGNKKVKNASNIVKRDVKLNTKPANPVLARLETECVIGAYHSR